MFPTEADFNSPGALKVVMSTRGKNDGMVCDIRKYRFSDRTGTWLWRSHIVTSCGTGRQIRP